MSNIQDWGVITIASLQNLWSAFIGFLPSLIGALIVLLIGWVIAIALGRLASQILRAFRIDQAVEKIGAKEGVRKAGYDFDISKLFGELVKWFLIIAAVMASAEILGLVQVTGFLTDVLLYVPNIIIAAVILMVGIVIAGFLSKLIRGSVKVAGFASADFIAAVTRWAILIFAILAALDQLGVARSIISTLLTGLVAMLAIAGGLSFGLGGRDIANGILKKIQKEITEE